MHYIIDGYNLMFRFVRVGNDLTAQREKIIQELNFKIEALNLNVTLVFDAHHQLGAASRTHYKQLEILFSAEGETADELIINELKARSVPFQCTVVTSDKKLAWLSRLQAAKTETVEEFMGWLNKRYANRERRSLLSPLSSKKKQQMLAKPLASPPISGTPATSCLAYYLHIFEEKLTQLATEVPSNKPRKPSLKKNKLVKAEPYSFESDEARWERLFNERLKES